MSDRLVVIGSNTPTIRKENESMKLWINSACLVNYTKPFSRYVHPAKDDLGRPLGRAVPYTMKIQVTRSHQGDGVS